MTNTIDNTQDVIDSRDIIERIEELQSLLDCGEEIDLDLLEELEVLKELQEQCSSCDDWQYGETLIHRDYFETYMDDMVADCYETPKDMPYWMTITLDYDALEQDYTSVSFNGQEFLIRSV